MAEKCEICGKKFGIFVEKHKLDDGRVVCYECLDKYRKEQGKDLPDVVKNYGVGMQLVLFIAGFLSSFVCIIAGLDMASIQSVAGNTVAEAYYNSVGVFVIGIGLFVGPLLWGIAYSIRKK